MRGVFTQWPIIVSWQVGNTCVGPILLCGPSTSEARRRRSGSMTHPIRRRQKRIVGFPSSSRHATPRRLRLRSPAPARVPRGTFCVGIHTALNSSASPFPGRDMYVRVVYLAARIEDGRSSRLVTTCPAPRRSLAGRRACRIAEAGKGAGSRTPGRDPKISPQDRCITAITRLRLSRIGPHGYRVFAHAHSQRRTCLLCARLQALWKHHTMHHAGHGHPDASVSHLRLLSTQS